MYFKTLRLCRVLCAAYLIAAFLAGCSGLPGTLPASASPSITVAVPTPVPTVEPTPTPKPALKVLSAVAEADPPVLSDTVEDPFTECNRNLEEAKPKDREKYNALYRAVEAMEPKLDVSSFKVSRIALYSLMFSLDTNFRLIQLKSFNATKNAKSVSFTYTGTAEEVRRDREMYYARLSHLIHNAAPEDYTDLQKFLSVYEAVCEMANYTDNMSDESTCTPYSIVMKGKGICWGYSMLTEFLLNKIGIPVRYVRNQPHAWNLVQIGGRWYQTDVTWGAGNAGYTLNNLNTVLMDDAARKLTLQTEESDIGEIIEGNNLADGVPPPACEDAGFNFYSDIGSTYAFDIEHETIYFPGEKGIERMGLDGGGRETVLPGVYAMELAFFNGMLYYVSINDNYLYRAAPDGKPELLDSSPFLWNLRIDGSKLRYKVTVEKEDVEKSIPLLKLAPEEISAADGTALSPAEMPRGRSFRFVLKFSSPLDMAQDLNEKIFLVDGEGGAIPLHFIVGSDNATLTVRPKTCIENAGNYTLFIKGLAAADNAAMETACKMTVTVKAGE